jgi:uncharacterized protein
MSELTIVDNPDESRYDAYLGTELVGVAVYQLMPELITFSHTEVDDAYEGAGVGSSLARHVLDDARRRGLAVEPRCPFIASWIERHPDYRDLVRASQTSPSTGSTSGTNP